MLLTRRRFLPLAAAAATIRPAAAASGPELYEAQEGLARILPPPAGETPVFTFGGGLPGRMLRLRKGEALNLRLKNRLGRPMTLHFDGVRGPNAFDGVAGLTQKPVGPGETFDYSFTPPDSGTFWMHSLVAADRGELLDRGLAATLLVEEETPAAVDHDVVVELDDWRLDAKGAPLPLIEADGRGAGRVGPLVAVNGGPAPLERGIAPNARLRLRLVNVATARVMVATLRGARPLVAAIDGQPCDAFEPVRQTVPIGPGARFDLVFDMPEKPGEAVSLVLRGAEPPGAPALPDLPALVLTAEGEARPRRAPFESLPANPLLPPAIKLQDAKRVDLVIEGGAKRGPGEGQALAMGWRAGEAPDAAAKAAAPWSVNAAVWTGEPKKPLFSVKRGQPVSLGFVNRTAFPHQMKVHGHVMRLLHPLDDGWEPYWRDGVLVPEGKTSRVAFVADNPGRWLIRDASPERLAAGLGAWFEVT